jgi:hypothetical protein
MTHCRLASFHHSFTFHLDETFVLRTLIFNSAQVRK